MHGRRAIEADWRNVEDVEEAAKRILEESTHLAVKCPKASGSSARRTAVSSRRTAGLQRQVQRAVRGGARLNWRSDHVTGNGTTLAIS